jgi:transcriptional regulator with XRE-family HTH domain
MTAQDLKLEREKRGWGQVEAARRMGVSQPYLALLEEGKRRLTPGLTRRAALLYQFHSALPVTDAFAPGKGASDEYFVEHLSRFGYPGFAYVRPHVRWKNPGEVLLTALAQKNLEARVAEALPWLLLRYWQMDFHWLVEQAKKLDLQNRLGLVTTLARRLSEPTTETIRTRSLRDLERTLHASRLACEGNFFRTPRNEAERQWLMQNRTDDARHWNLLSDLRPEHLQYAG